MKAKEYVERIKAAENFTEAVAGALEDVLNEALDSARQRRTTAAVLATFRESFTKWKAVVAQLELAGAEVLFPKMLAARSPELFAVALKGNTFLGYKPDVKDQEKAELGRLRLEAELLAEHLGQFTSTAHRMGMRT